MKVLIDRLAGWWLDRRVDQAVAEMKKQPGYEEVELHQSHFDKDGWDVTMVHSSVADLAAYAAEMLQRNNAENYVSCVLMPRLDREMRPIEMTVRWYPGGLTPAQKNTKLEEELKSLRERVVVFASQLVAWGHNAAAEEILKEILEGPVEAPDYYALEEENSRLRAALRDISECVNNVKCYCADPPEDHEPPEDPDDWHAHSQYCPYYIQGYIAELLVTLEGGER